MAEEPRKAEADTQPAAHDSQQAQAEKGEEHASKATTSAAAASAESSTGAPIPSSSPPPSDTNATYRCRIVVHQQSFSEREVIFSPRAFPQLRVGDIVQITKATKLHSSNAFTPATQAAVRRGDKRPSLSQTTQPAASTSALPATSPAPAPSSSSMDASSPSSLSPLVVRVAQLEAVKGNIDCSILASLAALFDLTAREDVSLTVVSAESVRLDHLELSFDHAYIGRSDHWRIRAALQQQTVYVNKSVQVEGMKLRIDEMNRNSADDTSQPQLPQHVHELTVPANDKAGSHFTSPHSPSVPASPASSAPSVPSPLSSHPVRVSSGLVTADTKFTFRSRSARLLFLIQLSEEMWEYADDGEVYFEKVIGFLRLLLAQWKQTHVSHSLSLILFSRTHAQPHKQRAEHDDAEAEGGEDEWEEDEDDVDESTDDEADGEQEDDDDDDLEVDKEPFQTPLCTAPKLLYSMDNVGRLFVDHYEAVVDGDAPADDDTGQWSDRLLVSLKQSFHRYQHQMRWDRRTTITPEQIIRPHGMQHLPKQYQQPFTATLVASTAVDGNVLEAINCCVSIFDKHYVDRDLYRTGQNIVLFSAGHGLFLVSPGLAQLTKQRMVDGGIGCDLICMTRPPLHAVPLFIYRTELLIDPFSFIYARTDPPGQSPPPQQPQQQGDNTERIQQPKPPLYQRSTSLGQLSTNERIAHPPALTIPPHPALPASLAPMAGQSHLGDWYIPHWISIFFYDHQDANDTPFGTKTTKVQQAATRHADSGSTGSVTEEMDDDSSEDRNGDTADARHNDTGDMTDADESHDRRLRSSSPASSFSSPSSLPFVPLSSCRLYDFRPTDPAYLQHWLFDSSEVDGVNSRSSRLPPAAYSARYSPHEQQRASAHVSRPPSTADERRDADEAVFSFRKSILQAQQEQTDISGRLYKQLQLQQQQAGQHSHHSHHSPSNAVAVDSIDHAKLLPSSVNIRRSFTSASFATNNSAPAPFAVSPSAIVPLFSSSSPQFTWSLTFARRWAHLYSVREVEHIARFQPSWKSLCKPALLPLTVDYLQSSDELNKHYFEYNYTLTLPDDNSIESLMEEIICQRQAQNYQNVTGPIQQLHPHGLGHAPTSGSTSASSLSPHSPSLALSPSSPAPAPPPVHKPLINLAEAAAKRRAQHAAARCMLAPAPQMSNTSNMHLTPTNDPSSVSTTAITHAPPKARSPLISRKDSFRFPPPSLSSSPSRSLFPSALSPPLTHPSLSPPPSSPNSSLPPTSSPSSGHSSAPSAAPLVYYFSLRNQIHRLSYDSSTRTISVRRYVHKRVLINALQLISVPYRYYLYSPLTGGFIACDRDIEPARDDLDWNYADQLLAQQAEQYDDTLKYRKVRFAFLPPHTTGDGQQLATACKDRIAAMVKLWQTLLKKTPEELHIQIAKPVRRAKKTASDGTATQQQPTPSGHTQRHSTHTGAVDEEPDGEEEEEDEEEEDDEGDEAEDEASRTDSESGTTPPPVRRTALTTTPLAERPFAAVAEEAKQQAEEEEEESWEIGEQQHGMYNANDTPPPAALSNSSRHKLSSPTSAEVDRVLNDDVGFAVRVVPQKVMKVHLPPSTTSSSRPPVHSLFPATLPRDEWFFLEYEGFYHPLCCYHWEVHWLTASGMHIEGWCRQMQKRAERLGIALVKIPAAQHIRTADAFHQPIRISLRSTDSASAAARSPSATPAPKGDSLLTSPQLLIPLVQLYLVKEVRSARNNRLQTSSLEQQYRAPSSHSTTGRSCCPVVLQCNFVLDGIYEGSAHSVHATRCGPLCVQLAFRLCERCVADCVLCRCVCPFGCLSVGVRISTPRAVCCCARCLTGCSFSLSTTRPPPPPLPPPPPCRRRSLLATRW